MGNDQIGGRNVTTRCRARPHHPDRAAVCLGVLITFMTRGLLVGDDGQPGAANSKSAAAPPSATAPFDLHVVGPDGKPVADVKIEVFSEPLVQIGQLQRGKLVRSSSSRATLQADGEGRIALKPQVEWKRLALYIEAPGYARYWSSWSPSLRSEPIQAKLTVKLEPGWSMGGTFVVVNGKPIAGATILPPVDFAYGCPEALQWLRDKRLKSDADGKWHFDCVPLSSDPVTVQIAHPLFMPQRARLKRAEFGTATNKKSAGKIILGPGLTVTGRVTNKSGEPIVGAVVLTFYRNTFLKAVTDADGFYRMVGCPPEPVMFTARAKGFAPASQPVSRAAENAPVDFQLTRGGKFRLRVLDVQGKPIPSAKVFVYPFADYDTSDTNQLTDHDGAWEWNDAPASGCVVGVRLSDGSWLNGGNNLGAREQEFVLRQQPDLRVSGKVVDAQTKRPIERFRVVPQGSMSASRWLWADGFEATGGTYWLRHTNGQPAFRVRVEAGGYLPAESDPIKQNHGDATADFALTKGEDIVGTVLTADGKPARNAKMALLTAGAIFRIENGDQGDSQTVARRITDEAGHFRFPREKADYWLVITHSSGYAEAKCSPQSDPGNIQLTPWARLEGTYLVVGKPQPAASLSLSRPRGRFDPKRPRIIWSFSETTDADGRYVFDRLLPGQGTIAPQIELFDENGTHGMASTGSMPVRLEPGKTTHFDLGGSGRPVIGQLSWPPETKQTFPWNRVLLRVDSRDPRLAELKPSFVAALDAEGNFSIDAVPSGDYELSVQVQTFKGIPLKHRFSVPQIDKRLSQRPVDLGVLTLKTGDSR